MANSINTIEKNVQASFGYVKKDILMLNDSISDVHDKIQHLSLNHASLMEKLSELESKIARKPAKKKEKRAKTVKSKVVAKRVKKAKKAKKKPKKTVVKETITYS